MSDHLEPSVDPKAVRVIILALLVVVLLYLVSAEFLLPLLVGPLDAGEKHPLVCLVDVAGTIHLETLIQFLLVAGLVTVSLTPCGETIPVVLE